MKKNQQRRKSLVYHAKPKPGKTEVVPTKSYRTQRDLALAYSPGVAIPCQEIEKQLEMSLVIIIYLIEQEHSIRSLAV